MHARHQIWLALAALLLLPGCGDNLHRERDAAPLTDAWRLPDAGPIVPRAEPTACRFDVPSSLGLAEGTDYDCGDLMVFEDRDAPGRTIAAHYLRFRSDVESSDATIYLDDGPGGNGGAILEALDDAGPALLAGLLADGDFLVLSQRGASLSVPALVCPDSDCSGLSDLADLPAYNTAYSADDVDDLRAVLGYDQLNLYGISYGSRLALELLRRHGARVRCALLDGAMPAQTVWPAEIPASLYGALGALDASCAAAGACGTAFGDLEVDFVTGLAALDDQPVSFDYQGHPIHLDGWTYASLLFQLMYSRSAHAWLPLLISDLAERRTDRVADLIGDALSSLGARDDLATGLYYSVVCGELFDPPDESAFEIANAAVPATIREAYAWTWYGLLDDCQAWPVGEPGPTSNQPVGSDVRTLLASGSIDPITPPSFGEVAAASLTDREVVVLADSGHGATLQSPCGMQILVDFLTDPSAAPDTGCAASITTDYVLPAAAAAAAPPDPASLRSEVGAAPIPPAMRQLLLRATGRID